jgi:hypothetical protein
LGLMGVVKLLAPIYRTNIGGILQTRTQNIDLMVTIGIIGPISSAFDSFTVSVRRQCSCH